MMNPSSDVNETLRELCFIGDVELIKKFVDQYKPDLNSQNKVNGWLSTLVVICLDTKLRSKIKFLFLIAFEAKNDMRARIPIDRKLSQVFKRVNF
jgi:hypothetical protein